MCAQFTRSRSRLGGLWYATAVVYGFFASLHGRNAMRNMEHILQSLCYIRAPIVDHFLNQVLKLGVCQWRIEGVGNLLSLLIVAGIPS